MAEKEAAKPSSPRTLPAFFYGCFFRVVMLLLIFAAGWFVNELQHQQGNLRATFAAAAENLYRGCLGIYAFVTDGESITPAPTEEEAEPTPPPPPERPSGLDTSRVPAPPAPAEEDPDFQATVDMESYNKAEAAFAEGRELLNEAKLERDPHGKARRLRAAKEKLELARKHYETALQSDPHNPIIPEKIEKLQQDLSTVMRMMPVES